VSQWLLARREGSDKAAKEWYMSLQSQHHYTLEEYLALERESEVRYEYWNGEVFAMSGGTLYHDRIMGNVFDLLRTQLRRKGCEVFTNNMQIKVEVERFNNNDLLLNPVLLWEVLSPSTEAYDRGDKFTYYKSIPSFCEYLLIAQHRPHITHYAKQQDNVWAYEEVNDLNDSLSLSAIGCILMLSDVYRDVEFTP
jgi:Uma2 family endonuclease